MGFTVSKVNRELKHLIKSGDEIQKINNEDFIDYVDYVYFSAQKNLKIDLKRNGKHISVNINKDEDTPLALEFKESLFGKKRVCLNNCIFCFVSQLPKGLRKTLYVKDEDWRYSLIMGNYITMSSISDAELTRICKRGASPLYISVHTIDEGLRKKILGNETARPIKETLNILLENNINFHAQVVLMAGINDGKVLKETIGYLSSLENCLSLAVVPVGLTKFREGLYPISVLNKESAEKAIDVINIAQKEILKKRGTRFVFPSDEMYLRAKYVLPQYEEYEDFCQIENGVGMIRLFEREVKNAIEDFSDVKPIKRKISIATGMDSYDFMVECINNIKSAFDIDVLIYPIKNDFFGDSITVSGLITGGDLNNQLLNKPLGKELIIPDCMLRDRKDTFLDDVTVDELSESLNVKVCPVKADGESFVLSVLGQKEI
ncbi:MAG: DUF512 domain-containing protein [Eubacteriales bacterium]